MSISLNRALDRAAARAEVVRRLPPPQVRRLLRERSGLTQEEVAGLMKVSRPTVSRWESGSRSPRRKALERYLAVLDRLAAQVR